LGDGLPGGKADEHERRDAFGRRPYDTGVQGVGLFTLVFACLGTAVSVLGFMWAVLNAHSVAEKIDLHNETVQRIHADDIINQRIDGKRDK
jgi:hypothetical protein